MPSFTLVNRNWLRGSLHMPVQAAFAQARQHISEGCFELAIYTPPGCRRSSFALRQFVKLHFIARVIFPSSVSFDFAYLFLDQGMRIWHRSDCRFLARYVGSDSQNRTAR